MDQAALQEIHLDVLCYNTILRKAFVKVFVVKNTESNEKANKLLLKLTHDFVCRG